MGSPVKSVIHVMTFAEVEGSSPLSGAERHLDMLMRSQAQAGWDVHLAAPLFRDGPQTRAFFQSLKADGVETHVLPTGPERSFFSPGGMRQTFSIVSRLRSLIRSLQPTVLHTHLDRGDIYGKLAGRWAGASALVSSVHNNEPHYEKRSWRMLWRGLDRCTRRYIAISGVVRDQLQNVLRVAPGKISTIHYGVEEQPCGQTRDDLRDRFGIPRSTWTVGFVGRLVPQKNVALLIRAALQLPDIHFVIVGAGVLHQELRDLAGAAGNVQFLGYQDDARAFFRCIDLFCLPSLWEGLGLVLIEAMLAKTPILGSQAGAIPEILGDGQFGFLFPSNDLTALIRQLSHLQKSPHLLEQMSNKAHRYAIQSFSVKSMVERTFQVYDEAVGHDARLSSRCVQQSA